MTTHEELVAEMASLERLTVQDRLKLARKRRAQQLKRWVAHDKEFIKKSRKSTVGKTGQESPKKRRINFAYNIQLLEAAARGDIDEVQSLLESGVDPNIGNEDGLTALHQCCIDNNEGMMKLLVEHNADVNVTDRELWTPLHASSTCGHVNLARFLVSNGAELLAINSDGNMPYDICEDDLTLDYIESQMAEKGITQEHIDELRDVAPNRMLVELVELKSNDGDLEPKGDVGATYLHIAAANGYDKVAKFLLDNNVDVNAKDIDGWQPIHAAACWAHGEMIQLLVQYGADLEAKTNNEETPITICEDEDLRNLINQLKAELHAHRSLDNKLVRRNSSRNKRSSSIRRSSKREKGEMRKLDAKGEAMFIQSQVSTDEIPATNIDEVKIETEELPQSPTSTTSMTIDRVDKEDEEGEEINGALETDIIPMPVITEEIADSPVRKARLENGEDAVMQNGGGDGKKATGLAVSGLLRQPKSILKKRKEQEVIEDAHLKKSRKEKFKEVDARRQELEEERQKEREEHEKAKQQEKEQRQRKKEEREHEKQRIREEKKQLRKREKEEKEREKQLKRKTIADQTENIKTEDNQTKVEEDQDNHTGNIETLAELKRQRASEHAKRTLSGESADEFETAWSEGRKDSFDILKDHQSQNSTKKKSPHIARKLFLHRPASGSYTFTESSSGDAHRDSTGSEQNGISDQGGANTSDVSNTSKEPYPSDPPLKRFTAVGREIIGGDEDRRCCIIL